MRTGPPLAIFVSNKEREEVPSEVVGVVGAIHHSKVSTPRKDVQEMRPSKYSSMSLLAIDLALGSDIFGSIAL